MVIRNGTVVTPFRLLHGMEVVVAKDQIVDIRLVQNDSDDDEIVDANGGFICPGFVDIHTHGGGGSDFMDASDSDYQEALKFHALHGTTSIVTSTVSAPMEQIERTLKQTKKCQNKVVSGCRVLGAHLEGPHLSVKNKGAHSLKYIKTPNEELDEILKQYADVIIHATVSPELPGSIELIRKMKEYGIRISGGHDDASDSEIFNAIDAGMTNITHLFCAMSSICMKDGKRQVGLAGISLIDDRLTVELIADNHHLSPELVKLAYLCKGADKCCVVSDCLRAGGMPADGVIYTLGPRDDPNAQKFVAAGDVAALPDGSRLAGSVQPIGRMVKNLVFDCGISLSDAIRMASLTPAKIIGFDSKIGSIEPNKKADFCIMDSNLNPFIIITDGIIRFKDNENS